MNTLKVEAIKHSFVPFKHLDNIKKIKGSDRDRFLQDINIFTYGRIIGVREERAKRNGNRCKLDAPRLVDSEPAGKEDNAMELKEINKNFGASIDTLEAWNELAKKSLQNALIEQGVEPTQENVQELQENINKLTEKLDKEAEELRIKKKARLKEIAMIYVNSPGSSVPFGDLYELIDQVYKLDESKRDELFGLGAIYKFGFIEGIRKERRKKRRQVDA